MAGKTPAQLLKDLQQLGKSAEAQRIGRAAGELFVPSHDASLEFQPSESGGRRDKGDLLPDGFALMPFALIGIATGVLVLFGGAMFAVVRKLA